MSGVWNMCSMSTRQHIWHPTSKYTSYTNYIKGEYKTRSKYKVTVNTYNIFEEYKTSGDFDPRDKYKTIGEYNTQV